MQNPFEIIPYCDHSIAQELVACLSVSMYYGAKTLIELSDWIDICVCLYKVVL
jgi:hypothetical protein